MFDTVISTNEDHGVSSHSGSVLLGYKVLGDNLDKNVKPRYKQQDKQTLSMHCYAVRD